VGMYGVSLSGSVEVSWAGIGWGVKHGGRGCSPYGELILAPPKKHFIDLREKNVISNKY
jgi:hypothetical protein